ncbi:hypothetical protein A7A78_13945 [Aequorivita soesokkakensis]|uniref:TonB C-terminal domain-containing protein n=1 Tax=Aequorivita soesokkakensis TaxID=1385699 RepID=A0A1A9LBZ7_9FLAO|nr:energy transducer TonB [Aequorivita soesokkakensis]OAD90808.1 hypothetical protein A7A78_13945 [Aequorivita soesokkakensis]
MLKKLLIITAIIATSSAFAQEGTITEVTESEMTKGDVPYAVIENVPVYPGCEGNSNVELKECMSSKISAFVSSNFNMKKIESLNLAPKVYRVAVQFKIDKEGKVVDVRARAAHYEIEKEAVRVVGNLPQMEPGKQRGEAVGVLYSLPIVFQVEAPQKIDSKKDKRKSKN